MSPLCFLPNGKLLCYKDGALFELKDGVVKKKLPVFSDKKEKILAKIHLIFRGLRLGIRASIALSNDRIVFSFGNMLYEYNLKEEKLSDGFCLNERIRPLIFTKVEGIEGFDDMLLFGGYLGNPDKKPVQVYKREKEDQWGIIYTFPQGTINHVHNIIADPYRQCLWAFTGDFDEASAIWKVTDNFKNVERVAYNNQKYRGCVAFALPEGLLYATDAPYADNYVYLMNTDTYEVRQIMPIDGSCIYGCQWKDKYVFSSTVEGDGRNTSRFQFYFGHKRGAGIKNNYVHLYAGNLRDGFKETYKEKKDCMPLYTFQFGAFKFPYGENNGDKLYIQPIATKINDLSLISIQEDIL